MDNVEDDASYPPNPDDLSQDNEFSQLPNLHVRCLSTPQQNNFADVENGDDDYDTEDTEDDYDHHTPNGYTTRMVQDADLERQEHKKRKLKKLLSNYVFAPRAVVTPSVTKPSRGGRNSLTDWTEHESNVLLDAWGERFLKHNRKSVRSEEWHEVADKVSEGAKIKRTETQCRNRLDTLKKKYKKEKAMLAQTGELSSKWVFFRKMDMFLSPSSNPANGDVSVTSKVYPSRANSSDEMRDSLGGDSEAKNGSEAKNESDNLDDFPPKRARMRESGGVGDPFKLLADSIDKFTNTYEKIESNKSKQLVELENMKMDLQRDLELQKRKILKRTQVEIAKIWGHTSEDNDFSPDNVSE